MAVPAGQRVVGFLLFAFFFLFCPFLELLPPPKPPPGWAMLVPGSAPKRRQMSSLGDAVPGRCHPWEISSPGDVRTHPTARIGGPGAVPAHPDVISKVQACPGTVVTTWVSATLPGPWIFGEAGEYVQDLGGLQRCCFGAESRDFLDAPRRVAVVPKTHTLCPLSLPGRGGGVPRGFPNRCLNQSWAVGTAQEGVQAHGDGGVQKLPTLGQKEAGLSPGVPGISRATPARGAAGGDADKAQSGVPAGAAGPGGGRGGGQLAVVAAAVPKRPRPHWPCSSGGSSWP